ncbi:MAG TPA: magnesium transporter [Dehalococcoidia bacterium]|nr:magnesium transporter [Chloroflexota bacterium]MQF94785.1 magnesium transporter [SAR202 cluster bacterium]HAA96073.1 magnesium transporter [Dehalococcoidia bacterium]HCL26041.1 magnesium transporter [Dehalococcoidia bacterium]
MMEQPQTTPASNQVEDQPRPPEEVIQELVQEIGNLLDAGQQKDAMGRFALLHPVDQGEVLDGLARDLRQALLVDLNPAAVAEILEYLDPEESFEMVGGREPVALAQVLDLTGPDVAVDLLRQIPEDRQQETLEAMSDASEVTELLQYQDDTAGGLMTPEYPVVKQSTTIPNALDQLRLLGPDAEDINSMLVVDEQQHMVGSLSVMRLALARPNAVVGDIMDLDFHSVTAETDQEECARVMQRYNLGLLPVVDDEGHLTGVILAEDLVDVVEEEATEDMFRIASVGGERISGPLRNSLRSRLPWLYINLATAFLAAVMVSLFEDTIAKVVALAVFLPVVASQGGIGGTQTVTLVVRSMALGEVPRRLGLRLLAREVALGIIHGIALGVVVGVVAYLWKGNLVLGLVLGLAMLGNMLVAGMAGAGVPLLLRQLRMDPAVSSAVFVTTFTDVIGFVLFLSMAAIFVQRLV